MEPDTTIYKLIGSVPDYLQFFLHPRWLAGLLLMLLMLQKSGKLTSWGNGSLSHCLRRVFYVVIAWFLPSIGKAPFLRTEWFAAWIGKAISSRQNEIPPWKLAWDWNMASINRKYSFKWWMFHCDAFFLGVHWEAFTWPYIWLPIDLCCKESTLNRGTCKRSRHIKMFECWWGDIVQHDGSVW